MIKNKVVKYNNNVASLKERRSEPLCEIFRGMQ